jgi:hypothetical protein
MAAPNIVNVTTIYANNSLSLLTQNTTAQIINNPASSATSYKVNTIIISNKDASNSQPITININNAAGLGGTNYPVANNLSIPALSTLTLIDKGTSFYLLENQSIGALTTAPTNTLAVIASWEQIS